jgi:hypothetical protein
MDAMTEIWRNVTHESRKNECVCTSAWRQGKREGYVNLFEKQTTWKYRNSPTQGFITAAVIKNHTHESHFIRPFRTADENR